MPRGRRMGVPKAPKPPKLPRPKVKDLRAILKGLVTLSVTNRIASLAYALHWYDQAVPYIVGKGKLPADGQKKLEWAVKCRKQGMGTQLEGEKETAFRTAIQQYEKVCVALKPPSVAKFYEKLDRKKPRLEKKHDRMGNKFGPLLEQLGKAFGGRVKLEVVEAEKPFQMSPELNRITFNRQRVKELYLQSRQKGFLEVALQLLPLVARCQSITADGQGKYLWDPNVQVQKTDEMIDQFLLFVRSQEAPKKLVRFGRATDPVAPKAATGQKRVGPKGQRQKLGGLVIGTAIYTVFLRLADEQEHDLQKVIEGIQAGDPVGRVKQLGRYGSQWGEWKVEFLAGDKVKLTMLSDALRHAASIARQTTEAAGQLWS